MRLRDVTLVSTLAIGVIASHISAQERLASGHSNTYGSSSDSLYRIGSMEFMPFDTSDTSFFDYFEFTSGQTLSRTMPGMATPGLVAMPHLPSGALVTGVELDFCDDNATYDVSLTAYSAASDGTGVTPLGTITSNGASSGCGSNFVDLSSKNFTLDNGLNEIFFVVNSPDNSGGVGVSGAIVHYKLQVSPAPGSATFGDVPTSSPQFQFVEALVAAGITAGCGGGNYCPNNPVTRGQMAVFLAKALGLQWQ